MTTANILNDIRVLDLTRVMSGPFCTSMLADLGAEIIKIELPEIGDESRHFGPYKEDESAYFMMLNRNKKSVTINLKSAEGLEILKALIPKCDVIVENFRPGVMERLGLDEHTVQKLNPSIIYARISGFGQNSPLKEWPAFDLVIQAMSGLMSLTGPKGGPPTAVGESLADVCTGMFGAFGIMAALFERERTGKVSTVDVAMLDSMMAMQLTGLSRQLYSGQTPTPVGNRHPVTYPVDSFPTRDGDVVMVCFSQATFQSLCSLMEKPELATDSRFSDNELRNQHEEELRRIITEWTSKLSQEEAIKLLQDSRIPAGPVWNLQQLTQSKHVKTRGLIQQADHNRFKKIPVVPQPVKFSGASISGVPSVPLLGENTDQVLSSLLNMNDEKIADLHEKKII